MVRLGPAVLACLGLSAVSAGQTNWGLEVVSARPTARGWHAAAYDVVRQRTVLFGGNDPGSGFALGDTWMFDGLGWTQARPTSTPPGRSGHAMAYDVARRRVVLFGGFTSRSGGFVSDTWEWDGANWLQIKPKTSPLPRRGHAMVYDVIRNRVVLFGGEVFENQSVRFAADTWEWDGRDWTRVKATTSPSARTTHAMSFDVKRHRTILFGGRTGPGSVASDTWAFDGTTWSRIATAVAPTARAEHGMAYDLARDRTMLFGGVAGTIQRDTWEFDGKKWTRSSPTASPPARQRFAMAYDVVRGRVLLHGGAGVSPGALADSWEFRGTTWTEPKIDTLPPARESFGMVYDPDRRRTVVFAGWASGKPLRDTWEHDGFRWIRRAPATSPPARQSGVMVYDTSRRRTVVFGGGDASFGLVAPDVWEWDGTNWASVSTAWTPPDPRYAHAMAFDDLRGRTVLYGGIGARAKYYADTWEWDGKRWRQIFPKTSPGIRAGHAMAFDPTRGRVVLHGGVGNGLQGDTWEWDGTDWVRLRPKTSPPARSAHKMVYDASHHRMVVFGGHDGSSKHRDDTWVWDGEDWSEVRSTARPKARKDYGMVYDRVRRRTFLFGGVEFINQYVLFGDVWKFEPAPPALSTDIAALPLRSAGTQVLELDAGVLLANSPYWIFGSFTGTRPGVVLGGIRLPLVPDVYTDVAFQGTNMPVFANFRGVLDVRGRATARLNVPRLTHYSSFRLIHAFVVFHPIHGWVLRASNATSLMFR